MHSICKNINHPAYIDYGNEPPPAATTSFNPNNRKRKDRLDQSNTPGNRVCMPHTCANKGVCYEPYDDGILKAALVRQEYAIDQGEESKWMTSSSSNSICDCDLTTYTGPTCEEGKNIQTILLFCYKNRRQSLTFHVSLMLMSYTSLVYTYCDVHT